MNAYFIGKYEYEDPETGEGRFVPAGTAGVAEKCEGFDDPESNYFRTWHFSSDDLLISFLCGDEDLEEIKEINDCPLCGHTKPHGHYL